MSQSVFLVRIAFYKDGKPYNADFESYNTQWLDRSQIKRISHNILTGIGYSDMALLATISCSVGLLVICRLITGFRMYVRGLPLGGTNSAVISAACHLQYENEEAELDVDIAKRPLQWGVTVRGGTDKIGHLSFSDREVEEPEIGHFYAGSGQGS